MNPSSDPLEDAIEELGGRSEDGDLVRLFAGALSGNPIGPFISQLQRDRQSQRVKHVFRLFLIRLRRVESGLRRIQDDEPFVDLVSNLAPTVKSTASEEKRSWYANLFVHAAVHREPEEREEAHVMALLLERLPTDGVSYLQSMFGPVDATLKSGGTSGQLAVTVTRRRLEIFDLQGEMGAHLYQAQGEGLVELRREAVEGWGARSDEEEVKAILTPFGKRFLGWISDLPESS